MKYFKRVESYDDLKKQFRELLKENHPDNGGDAEKMKEINAEFDVLFKIWKDRREPEKTAGGEEETADIVRSRFYTEFGWEGSRHRWDRTLKEVAQIVRTYVREKYPAYKFSVRTEYFSMGQELHVELKESPVGIYKKADELDSDDMRTFRAKASRNNLWKLNSWTDEEFKNEYTRITEENGDFYKALNEITRSVVKDVDDFVRSYNYQDCDGMIDYFHVDFYYFGCCPDNGKGIKIVPKTPRIKNAETSPAAKKEAPAKNAGKTVKKKELQARGPKL